ncbi:hypothetical protein N7495_009430 [Penicillium taxi]|uniref:uncharacterized protein n=1 Tax=Penicillium taxi TaxID=168475 RepID=UPI002544DEA7|nr:uncharacterized protein N7495_009430 [Penicillium taxi]KAJ5884920.1 hypothetical protein N7495_009430 [Penicillium taxi]
MAAVLQGHQVHPEGRTWKSHFPNGDLWIWALFQDDGSLTNIPNPQISGYQDTLVATYDDFGSTDHRGTPERPGRVVTVIERKFWETLDDPLALGSETEAASTVWGAAYHIPASHAEEVHDYLDEREIDGYSAHYTPFHPVSNAISTPTSRGENGPTPIICMVYIGQPSNPQFLRDPARRDPQDVAQVISAGHGLSGKNAEYLFMLEQALEGIGLGTADIHVTDLVRRVKAIETGDQVEAEEYKAELEIKKSLASTHDELDGNRNTIE